MSIKLNYNFKSIEVKDAVMRVDRIFGSSKEGWNSLVGVYVKVTNTAPGVEADEDKGIEAKESYQYISLEKIDEFNFQTTFKEDTRGYESIYKALKDKFGGTDV